ncbi:MAG TPA: MBL fold metallo-hydrolase [bacterium]
MLIEKLEVGVFAENCYVVGCEQTREGVVIDPGDEGQRILRAIEKNSLKIKYILITHAHLDHVKEAQAVKSALNVPLCMHRADQLLLDNLPAQAAAFGLSTSGIPQVDQYINEGESINFGKQRFEILFTPGHSPGSVSFVTQKLAFVGDVLFAGSIGRTDLPGGDFDMLIQSIKSKLYPLGDDTQVYPGHGPHTTIGGERRTNPFLI